MLKITMVISSLRCGGAERVATNMANYWAERGECVSIMQPSCQPPPPFFPLHPSIETINAAHFGHMSNEVAGSQALVYSQADLAIIGRDRNWLNELRNSILATQPDVVISFIDMMNIRVLLALAGTSIPVIVTDHTVPNIVQRGQPWCNLRTRCYAAAAAVVLSTTDAIALFPQEIRVNAHAIANPLQVPAGTGVARSRSNTSKTLLSLGRLDHEKGVMGLVRTFAAIHDNHPRWQLELWGDGPLRPYLQRRIAQLGLQRRVFLHGTSRQAADVFAAADLFVLPSRFEGYGNVLWEALACGVPVVSFDCPCGPKHIVRNEIDGLLVKPNDMRGLATALHRLMANDALRHQFAKRAPEIRVRLNRHAAMQEWYRLIDKVTLGKRSQELANLRVAH